MIHGTPPRTASPGARHAAAVVFSMVLLAGAPASSGAQVPRVTGANADSALAETLRRFEGEYLSLDRAVDLALANAVVVQEARANYEAAAGALTREKGAFGPVLFGEVTRSERQTPSASPFVSPDVVESDLTSTSGGVRMLIPFGTEIEASVGVLRDDTNNEFTSLNPSYRADAYLALRQPLLKGLGPGTSADKTAAERFLESTAANYFDTQQLTRSRVEANYWELYAAERDLAVQRLIVEQAEALLQQARLRSSAGLVGPNEVANARVFLAQQRLAALDVQEQVGEISDRLSTLLGTRPVSESRFRPQDEPPAEFPVEPVDTLLERAFRSNASLRAAQENLYATEALYSGARWNGLPELDLVGSVGGAGLAGTAQPVVFGTDTLFLSAEGSGGDALGQAVGRDFPNWSIGLELNFPLFLGEERGERRRLKAEVDRAASQVEAVRRGIEELVRDAHRELTNMNERLEVAREGLDASFDQVRIGTIEYDNGRTTAFELVRLGADLAEAQARLSDSLVRAATASAIIQYLTAEFPTTGLGETP